MTRFYIGSIAALCAFWLLLYMQPSLRRHWDGWLKRTWLKRLHEGFRVRRRNPAFRDGAPS